MEQVVPDLIIPIDAGKEGKRAGKLSGDLLAALNDTGENGDNAKDWDEPKQTLFVANLLKVKTGEIGKENICPRQKEADAQTQGA